MLLSYVLIGIAALVAFIVLCYIFYKVGGFTLLMYIADAVLGDDDTWGGGSSGSPSDSSSFGGGGDFGGGGGGSSW